MHIAQGDKTLILFGFRKMGGVHGPAPLRDGGGRASARRPGDGGGSAGLTPRYAAAEFVAPWPCSRHDWLSRLNR